jgi:hypothetical protein
MPDRRRRVRRLLFLALTGGRRVRDLDRLEEVVGGRRAVLRARLHAQQHLVVELELRGLPDQRRGARRIVLACELDRDLVARLLPDDRLRHAELVDAAANDRDRARHVVARQLVAARRHRLQDDLEATLQVESLVQRLVTRRALEPDERDARQRQQDQEDETEM